MKIKIEQLDELTRSRIARALNFWAERNEENFPVLSRKYREVSYRVSHADLLLCEYINIDAEKGGYYV